MSFVGFDVCCNAVLNAVRNVWTVESNVLSKSRSGLHKLGFRVTPVRNHCQRTTLPMFLPPERQPLPVDDLELSTVDPVLERPWVRSSQVNPSLNLQWTTFSRNCSCERPASQLAWSSRNSRDLLEIDPTARLPQRCPMSLCG